MTFRTTSILITNHTFDYKPYHFMRKIGLHFLGSLLTAIILFACLTLYSILLDGNLYSILTFWGALVPIIAYSSSRILEKNSHLLIALVGNIIFYSFMVFMTFKHYGSDFFTVMKYSLVSSIFLMITYYYFNKYYDNISPSNSR